MSTVDAADNLAITNNVSGAHDEQPEEVHSLSSEVTALELLQCGDIVSRNLEAAVAGLRQLMKLVCGALTDRSEVDVVCPILKRASEVLAITVGHIDSTMLSVEDALTMFFRCLNNDASQWHKLPVHLKGIQDHTRTVRELWSQNRDFLNDELLDSLTRQFYYPQSIFPHLALWVAQLTRVEHFFPRIHAWGQIPYFIASICAALDPIPQLLDRVEAYAVDMGDRLRLALSQPSGLQEVHMKMIKPSVDQLVKRWTPYFCRTHDQLFAVKGLNPSRYLPYSLEYS